VVVQTNTLVLVGTFGYALGPYYDLLVIEAALILVGVLLLCVKPHRCVLAGQVSLQSVGVLFITTFAALIFLPYRNLTPPPGYTMAMGALVLIAHVAFLLCALWQLVRLVEWLALLRIVVRCCQKSTCAATSGIGGQVVQRVR
jgi:hypothetical protein